MFLVFYTESSFIYLWLVPHPAVFMTLRAGLHEASRQARQVNK
jgi:hypothetical protein